MGIRVPHPWFLAVKSPVRQTISASSASLSAPPANFDFGLDPFSWTPNPYVGRSPRCRTRGSPTRRFRDQLVALVQAGRTPEDLAREFEPTAQSIANWVAQADRDAGRRTDCLTTAERAELTQLRRENRQLKVEREILSKAAAWFAQETALNTKRSSGS